MKPQIPWLRVFVEGVVIVCARHGAARRKAGEGTVRRKPNGK